MCDINLNNIYDHVKYDLQDNVLHVTWDKSNPAINSWLVSEKTPCDPRLKYSCMWVQKIKEYLFWEEGITTPLDIKSTYDGEFRVVVGDETRIQYNFAEIGEDGYLYIRPDFNNPEMLKKCNCVYNDLVENGEDPYIPEQFDYYK